MFYVPLENFSLILRCHHYVNSALMTIEQWDFLNVSHLLWHGTSLYRVISENPWHSHLFPTKVCPDQGSNPNLPYARRDALPLSHRCEQLENLRSECFHRIENSTMLCIFKTNGFHFLFLFPFFSYFHNYIFAKPKVSNSFCNHMPCRLFNRKEVRTVISNDLKLFSCRFYLNVLKVKMNSK